MRLYLSSRCLTHVLEVAGPGSDPVGAYVEQRFIHTSAMHKLDWTPLEIILFFKHPDTFLVERLRWLRDDRWGLRWGFGQR